MSLTALMTRGMRAWKATVKMCGQYESDSRHMYCMLVRTIADATQRGVTEDLVLLPIRESACLLEQRFGYGGSIRRIVNVLNVHIVENLGPVLPLSTRALVDMSDLHSTTRWCQWSCLMRADACTYRILELNRATSDIGRKRSKERRGFRSNFLE